MQTSRDGVYVASDVTDREQFVSWLQLRQDRGPQRCR
ncbi:thioredoxin reductase [Devosia subaequoris]|uniref:Thioredoxin reductase n=1 Tax=Devosia subaequoris TaxID=395930 RepID=A0A7W6IMG5_9HYPH|nr:thioredoxin reductase [Devosia subaequoris]